MRYVPTKPKTLLSRADTKRNALREENMSATKRSSAALQAETSPIVPPTVPKQGAGKDTTVQGLMRPGENICDTNSQPNECLFDNRHTPLGAFASAHMTSNEEDEVKSVDGYTNPKSWTRALPKRVLDVLKGGRLEEPYTTDLWSQALQGEAKRASGHYACIRCHVPLLSPAYQVAYAVRGMAAFSRLNKRAVDLRVNVSTTAAEALKGEKNVLELLVHCRCCGGFLGVLTPDVGMEYMTETKNVFVVNSCCLEFMRGKHTRCKLDGMYSSDEEGMNDEESLDGLVPSTELNFDDPDIFEV